MKLNENEICYDEYEMENMNHDWLNCWIFTWYWYAW